MNTKLVTFGILIVLFLHLMVHRALEYTEGDMVIEHIIPEIDHLVLKIIIYFCFVELHLIVEEKGGLL